MLTPVAKVVIAICWILVLAGLVCVIVYPDAGIGALMGLSTLAAIIRRVTRRWVPYPSKTEYGILFVLVFVVVICAFARATSALRSAPPHNL